MIQCELCSRAPGGAPARGLFGPFRRVRGHWLCARCWDLVARCTLEAAAAGQDWAHSVLQQAAQRSTRQPHLECSGEGDSERTAVTGRGEGAGESDV